MTMMNLADHPSMLPEATAGELVERLIWQVTGAADSNRREALLTWAGLRGPTPTNDKIAAAHHVARGTVNYWTAALTRAAATITLTSSQREQLGRPFPVRTTRAHSAGLGSFERPNRPGSHHSSSRSGGDGHASPNG